MNLIDKDITEAVAGYDDIFKAETELRNLWRPQLLAAYAHRRNNYEQGKIKAQRFPIKRVIGVLASGTLVLIGLGITCRGLIHKDLDFLVTCCGGPLLIMLGLLFFVALGLTRFNGNNPIENRVPLHPLKGKGIYPNLRKAWSHGLSGVLKDEVPDYPKHIVNGEKDHGAEGERLFIRRLRESFDDRYFLLARSVQRRNEDVDVILIGPQGVWVFEVKHWSGEISWDDEGWRRSQTYFERGGAQVTREPEVGEPPDQQWIRAAAEVTRTLQYHAPKVLEQYPVMGKVQGGIVFTKPEARLKFRPGRPAFWGKTEFWIKTLLEVEPKADLDQRSTLIIIESLLDRHHELVPESKMRSMRAYAQGVVQEAETRLDEWIKGS